VGNPIGIAHFSQKRKEENMGFLFVAMGGAIGAMARYAISLIPVKSEFPLLTLVTNIIGAILIGFIVGITGKHKVSDNTALFLKTGLCGGFTTFSTFSLEAYNLFGDKQYMLGGLYVALSCIGCIFGVLCGEKISGIIKI
jgi:CrcB protein